MQTSSGNSKGKGPEVRVCWACLRTFKAARGARVTSKGGGVATGSRYYDLRKVHFTG